jgi:hypothetical protein
MVCVNWGSPVRRSSGNFVAFCRCRHF